MGDLAVLHVFRMGGETEGLFQPVDHRPRVAKAEGRVDARSFHHAFLLCLTAQGDMSPARRREEMFPGLRLTAICRQCQRMAEPVHPSIAGPRQRRRAVCRSACAG